MSNINTAVLRVKLRFFNAQVSHNSGIFNKSDLQGGATSTFNFLTKVKIPTLMITSAQYKPPG